MGSQLGTTALQLPVIPTALTLCFMHSCLWLYMILRRVCLHRFKMQWLEDRAFLKPGQTGNKANRWC